MQQALLSCRLCPCIGDITCIRDRCVRGAGFPSGVCRLLVAKLMDCAGPAWRFMLIAQFPYSGKDSVDGFFQRKLPQRKACFVLKRAGAELAPGIDMNGIGAATATKQPVVPRPAEWFPIAR